MLRTVSLATGAALIAVGVWAQDVETVMLEDMPLNAHPEFQGVEAAFVAGTFADEGLYAANSMMRDGAVFPPHSHPDDRLTMVISGTMFLGIGPKVDPANETVVQAGGIALTPAGTVHYMVARDGDVRILEIGSGPSGTAFPE